MSTIIKNYRNSFVDVQNQELRILMDPWINTANEGSWAGCNGLKYIIKSLKKKPVDYVYISHLHTDHFDYKFLKDLIKHQKKKFSIIIKKFKDDRLKKKIQSMNFKNIIDLEEYKFFRLGKFSNFLILPQLSASNTSNAYINYDLDTSCIFQDRNVNLYNQVDNPYSENDLKLVLKKLKDNKIDINFDLCFVPYCAASEYPQSFLKIDRKIEKNKIINQTLKRFFNISNLLRCKNIVPAGGSYQLDNIFYKLNKFLAIPSFHKIKKMMTSKKISHFEINNSNKNFYLFKSKKLNLVPNDSKNYFKNNFSFKTKNISYYNLNDQFNKKEIKEKLETLDKNLMEFKKKLYQKTKTKIKFIIWKNHPFKIKNLNNNKNYVEHNVLENEIDKKKKNSLKVHIFYKALLSILENECSWNEIQNHCFFERKPNVFDPDVVFWVNLYKFK